MADRRREVLGLLTAYRPVEPDEQEYRLEMLDLAAVSPDPFDRHNYEPGHFTASGFVLHPAGDRVLLIHHAKLGLWLQPGGHVDPGDATIIGAARREIEEETGVVDVTPVVPGLVDIDVHVFPESGDQPFHRHFDLRFGFVSASEALGSSDEVFDVRWATVTDLDHLAPDRSVRRPVGKLLAGG